MVKLSDKKKLLVKCNCREKKLSAKSTCRQNDCRQNGVGKVIVGKTIVGKVYQTHLIILKIVSLFRNNNITMLLILYVELFLLHIDISTKKYISTKRTKVIKT
jgi:hypothetical protein